MYSSHKLSVKCGCRQARSCGGKIIMKCDAYQVRQDLIAPTNLLTARSDECMYTCTAYLHMIMRASKKKFLKLSPQSTSTSAYVRTNVNRHEYDWRNHKDMRHCMSVQCIIFKSSLAALQVCSTAAACKFVRFSQKFTSTMNFGFAACACEGHLTLLVIHHWDRSHLSRKVNHRQQSSKAVMDKPNQELSWKLENNGGDRRPTWSCIRYLALFLIVLVGLLAVSHTVRLGRMRTTPLSVQLHHSLEKIRPGQPFSGKENKLWLRWWRWEIRKHA